MKLLRGEGTSAVADGACTVSASGITGGVPYGADRVHGVPRDVSLETMSWATC